MAGQRPHKAREAGPIFHGVGKRVDSSEILDIGGEKGARRLVDPDAAFEAARSVKRAIATWLPKRSRVEENRLGWGVISISNSSTF